VVDRCSTVAFARGLPKTQAAVRYASESHEGQRRQADGRPFILHPLEVGALLYQAGASDEVIAAGVLQERLSNSPLVGLLQTELETLCDAMCAEPTLAEHP
jgi:(p)ppGpp synthase/HD superfamily hydrolase